MLSETAVAVRRRMHVIDAAANTAEAQQMMSELGVTWLGLCREGVLIGAVHNEQLRSVEQDTPVGMFAECGDGRIHWLD